MVIEKVHGIQATGMSLNDRFTMLAAAAPAPAPMRPRRRPGVGSYFNQNLNFKNQNLFIAHIARRLEMQAKRQAVKQRLGMLRRFGSENSLPGLRRSNSFGNLSQASLKNRSNWRQSNGNLSRSASFSNLSAGAWRGMRRRGQPLRSFWGRFRGAGNRNVAGWGNRVPQRGRRGRPRTMGLRPRVGQAGGQAGGGQAGGGQAGGRGRGRGQARGRGRGQGRGRGGRTQPQKPVPSKEELDLQLDQYMATTKAALDHDLDEYMKNAMEQE